MKKLLLLLGIVFLFSCTENEDLLDITDIPINDPIVNLDSVIDQRLTDLEIEQVLTDKYLK